MTKSVIQDNKTVLAKFDYDIDLVDGSPIVITEDFCVKHNMPMGLARTYYVENCVFVLDSEGMTAVYNVNPLLDEE